MCYTQKWVPNDSTKVQVWFADATPSEVFALEVFDEYGTCQKGVYSRSIGLRSRGTTMLMPTVHSFLGLAGYTRYE